MGVVWALAQSDSERGRPERLMVSTALHGAVFSYLLDLATKGRMHSCFINSSGHACLWLAPGRGRCSLVYVNLNCELSKEPRYRPASEGKLMLLS